MPTKAPRACNCGAVLAPGARCPRCTQSVEQARGSAQARGYTKFWSRYAADFRARFPFCGQRVDGLFHGEHSRCTQLGRKVLADVVDHIVPLVAGGSLLDPKNHQSLCYSCNARKGNRSGYAC